MSDINNLLDGILDKKRSAQAFGMELDVMVMHTSFYQPLMTALGLTPAFRSCWELRPTGTLGQSDLFIYGIKIIWSSRLPIRQVWFRYFNPNLKPNENA